VTVFQKPSLLYVSALSCSRFLSKPLPSQTPASSQRLLSNSLLLSNSVLLSVSKSRSLILLCLLSFERSVVYSLSLLFTLAPLHCRSRSPRLSLTLCPKKGSPLLTFYPKKTLFFIWFSFEKRVKVVLLSHCSCKRMFFFVC